MKKILLRYPSHAIGAFGQAIGIHFRHDALDPHIHGESIDLAEAVKQRALSDLFAHSLDLYQLISAGQQIGILYLFYIYLAGCEFFGGINYIFRSEACSDGRDPLNSRPGDL